MAAIAATVVSPAMVAATMVITAVIVAAMMVVATMAVMAMVTAADDDRRQDDGGAIDRISAIAIAAEGEGLHAGQRKLRVHGGIVALVDVVLVALHDVSEVIGCANGGLTVVNAEFKADALAGQRAYAVGVTSADKVEDAFRTEVIGDIVDAFLRNRDVVARGCELLADRNVRIGGNGLRVRRADAQNAGCGERKGESERPETFHERNPFPVKQLYPDAGAFIYLLWKTVNIVLW
jgi:hypothetical protein